MGVLAVRSPKNPDGAEVGPLQMEIHRRCSLSLSHVALPVKTVPLEVTPALITAPAAGTGLVIAVARIMPVAWIPPKISSPPVRTPTELLLPPEEKFLLHSFPGSFNLFFIIGIICEFVLDIFSNEFPALVLSVCQLEEILPV